MCGDDDDVVVGVVVVAAVVVGEFNGWTGLSNWPMLVPLVLSGCCCC